jgi:formylglycine-generating enzyme
MKPLKNYILLVITALCFNTYAQSDYFLIVTSDLDCFLRVDGKQVAKIFKGLKKQIPITKGIHIISAITLDGYYKEQKEVNVKNQKEFVQINLLAKIASTKEHDKLLKRHNMVYVEGGSFQMGDIFGDGDRDEFKHKVQLNSFYIGRFEVTVEMFRQFIDATSYETRADKDGWAYTWNGQRIIQEYGANWSTTALEPKAPVACIAWLDAIKYCNWLSLKEGFKSCYKIIDTTVAFNQSADGYRLPTEAEWEFAARGGRKSKGYKFSGGNAGLDYGWVKENSDYKIHRVGLKKPNELGIYDMIGNVSEWCYDYYFKDYYLSDGGIHKNPIGPEDGRGRSQRGGGALFPVRYSRPSNRQMATENEKSVLEGFRIVRNAQ